MSNNFLTGTQFNYSTGAPESSLEFNDFGIQLESKILPTSKTFRNWVFSPWFWVATNGDNVNKLEDIAVTFVKSLDPNTGIEVVFATILFRQSSQGYSTPKIPGLIIKVFIFNQALGLLEEWVAETNHFVQCDNNGLFISYKKTFRPDWFDLVANITITVSGGYWYPC